MPVRNYKAQFDLEIKIEIYIEYSTIWLVNTKPQNKEMHCRISPRRACNPCGYTIKISSLYHRLLIFNAKLSTKTDGMGPFKQTGCLRM